MTARTLFGERLRYAREKNNMSQQDLAEALGTTQQRINKLETGATKTYKERFVLEAAKLLGVSPAWLALGEDDLDDMSDQALLVAKRYDRLPVEARNTILSLLLQTQPKDEPKT